MAKASELKVGDLFKWSPRQRKYREVRSITALVPGQFTGPENYAGMLVVSLKCCRQVILPPSQNVEISNVPKSLIR